MWFMSKNTHTARCTDLKRQKCCSKILPERESMSTKPWWTKSSWIISSSELICQANINTITVDPQVSLFPSYTEFFEGWELVTAFSRSELGEKRNKREKPNKPRKHFFPCCVSKQQLGMARMAEISELFSPGSSGTLLSSSPKVALPGLLLCCHTSICSGCTEKGRAGGAVPALCLFSGCQNSETSFLRDFLSPASSLMLWKWGGFIKPWPKARHWQAK